MADAGAARLRLLAFLSPVFPVGGFSYSHGLERAAHDGLLTDAGGLREWLADLLAFGSAWNDAVLFAEAHRRGANEAPEFDDGGTGGGNSISGGGISDDGISVPHHIQPITRHAADLTDLAHLAEALAGSEERHRETMLQGSAFVQAARSWPHPVLARLPEDCAYCVAAGAILGAHGAPLNDSLSAWLQAFCLNLIQAAIRLGITGQHGAMGALAALEPAILGAARRAETSTLDDLGSAALMSEIVALKHETQHSRLFRS